MQKLWHFLRLGLGVVAVTIFVGAALNWRNIHMVATYNPILLSPNYGEPESLEEARQQDLRYLRKLTSIDRSFSEDAKVAFAGEVDQLAERAGDLSDAEFYLGVSRAVALADNGHTSVSDQPLYREFNTIGAKLYWFADGLFIVRADREHVSTVGRRIQSIEGRPVDAVIAALNQYRGGAAVWRKRAMLMMIESPEIMHAAGLSESPERILFSLPSADGIMEEVVFEGRRGDTAAALPRRSSWMTLVPEALGDEGEGWERAFTAAGRSAPLYLRDIGAPLFETLPGNGRYIRTKTGFGTPEQSVQDFFKSALADVDDGALDYLVADYRWNSGGDFTRSIDFAKLAPLKLKPDGKLYILVGPNTFSASIVTVAMLKFYGGDASMIVGAPMGDRAQFWAERGMSFELPNSKTYVNYATGFHDWSNGCGAQRFCYTLNRKHEVAAGSLEPSVVIEPKFSDYSSGSDLVLDWVESRHVPAPSVDK